MSFQTWIVLGIVAASGFWLGRYLFRSFLRRGPVGCGSCCPPKSEELPVISSKPASDFDKEKQ